jgi:hypothetical protein
MRRSNCASALHYVPELTRILFLRILDAQEAKASEEVDVPGANFSSRCDCTRGAGRTSKSPATSANQQLPGDIRSLIEQGCQQLASTANSALTQLYWQIGQRIRTEVLQGARATYAEQIVSALARQLETDYGRGFSRTTVRSGVFAGSDSATVQGKLIAATASDHHALCLVRHAIKFDLVSSKKLPCGKPFPDVLERESLLMTLRIGNGCTLVGVAAIVWP